MKKVFSLLFALVMLVSMFSGCTQANTTQPTVLPTDPTDPTEAPEMAIEVGYARVAISPDFAMPMRGYGDQAERYSVNGTAPDAPIYTTCIAFKDEKGNMILLYHNDTIGCPADPYDRIRQAIADKTGVPFNRIMTSGTHTHHSIELTLYGLEEVQKYTKLLEGWMIEAAEAAIADLKPAKMHTARTEELENLNFIRHYIMKDGSVAGDNFGNKASGYKEHQSDADSVMQLVKFTREGGKDVILVNWQSHPHRNASASEKGTYYNTLSSNIVGIMRNVMEAELDCHFAYFTGASGNVNPLSKFPYLNITKDYKEQGAALANAAIAVAPTFKPVKTGELNIMENIVTANPKKSGAVVPTIPLYAFSIGEVAFVTAPYEMFDANGKEIKNGSPYETTFVITCANAAVKYIPSYEGFEYNGVISYGGNATQYERGTGELLVGKFLEMLNALHEKK